MSDRVILEAGQQAPDFSLQNQRGETVSLSQLRGSRVVLFAYPAAMTPACTMEACEFQESSAPLEAAGFTVLGISPDSVEKLARFAERDAIAYPLLSDPERETLSAYGAFGEKKNYGKIVQGVIRSTFVIDVEGKIEHALYNIKATGHVARVRKLLGV